MAGVWGVRPPMAVGVFALHRSHRPAEVVAVQAEVRHRVMHVRVFAESVGLANLARVAMTIGAVVSFHECGVDLIAHR